jgi:hypothetical protein
MLLFLHVPHFLTRVSFKVSCPRRAMTGLCPYSAAFPGAVVTFGAFFSDQSMLPATLSCFVFT